MSIVGLLDLAAMDDELATKCRHSGQCGTELIDKVPQTVFLHNRACLLFIWVVIFRLTMVTLTRKRKNRTLIVSYYSRKMDNDVD